MAARLRDLIDRYDALLFDAFGVLVDQAGARDGARDAIAAVRAAGRPLAIVTNDTSRLPATAAARFTRLGLPIGADEVIGPGLLLPGHVRAHALAGARTIVLGTGDSHAYAAAAGLEVVDPRALGDGALDVDAVLVCDDDGFDFLPAMNATLTACVRALDRGRALALVAPNPDLVYPRGGDALGFTAGAMVLMLEAALARRYRPAPRFTTLGKPEPGLFELARARLPAGARLVMIGDQLETDIAGARAAGVDGALVTGVSIWRDGAAPPDRAPQWLLADLR
ncbi:MAG TPA: HAD-IA family hydrolase [Kofleriaceae bacterium]|nr:HAD-IA family hydrolase [Kofleriaceae bacterium]